MNNICSALILQLTPFPAAFVCNYTMAYFLDIPRKKTFAFFISLASAAIQTLLRFWPGLSNPQSINTTAQVLLMFGCAFLFSTSPILHRFLAPILTIIITSIPEPLILLLFFRFGLAWNNLEDYLAMASDPRTIFFIRFPFFIFVTLFCIIGMLLWDKIVKKTSRPILLHFLPYLASQGILLLVANTFAELQSQDPKVVVYCLVLFVATVICIAADVVLFRSIQQAAERSASEERAAWAEYLLDQQQLYYNQYLSDVEDVSRIRHDLRNQLQTAYSLMAQHEEIKAQSILDNISLLLDSHKVYCKNRVVNAILSLKGSLYTQAGISFSFDCSLPDNLPLSDITLCSLFTNVLDNAYHATVHCKNEERKIQLTSHLKNGFFLLSCQNPNETEKAMRKPPIYNTPGQKHGLGLSILQQITDTHNGTIEITETETSFQIQILLQLEPEDFS